MAETPVNQSPARNMASVLDDILGTARRKRMTFRPALKRRSRLLYKSILEEVLAMRAAQ